jgi:hypothetical protein
MTDLLSITQLYSNEAAFLVMMLRVRLGNMDRSQVLKFLPEQMPDPEMLEPMIRDHEITGIAYDREIFEMAFGTQAHARIREAMARRAAASLLLFQELDKIDALFKAHRMDVIFQKGLPLGYAIFSDLTTRHTRDIDVLIRKADFLRIRSLLLEHGFMEEYFFPVMHARYYMGVNREAVFHKRTEGGLHLHLEVQWAPVLPIYDIPFSNEYFFANREMIAIAGKQLPSLTKTSHLMMLFLHHGVTDVWRSLKHLSDISFLIRNHGDQIDWSIVSRQIDAWGIRKNVAVGLSMCHRILGVQIPSSLTMAPDGKLLSAAMRSLLSYPLLIKRQTSIPFIRRQLMMTDDLKAKSRLLRGYFRKILSPSLFELENIHLPPDLFLLYYPLKCFRPIIRWFIGK